MKGILLAVTGMSPAVVTETLYALHRDGRAWPEAVYILTTNRGESALRAGLPAAIEQLCTDYGRPRIAPEALHIRVIPDAEGNPIEDARSLADHEALGDFIMREVRNLSAQPALEIHASIAGGRKTMTYYLGYAMSLFGRPQDRLSHVLVSEGYEHLPGFYYPPPYDQWLTDREGQARNAAQAEVILADIPFIRLRRLLPKVLLEAGDRVRFRDLVCQIDLGEREPLTRALRLHLPADRFGLELSTTDGQWQAFVPLKCVEYAFYRVILRPLLRGEPGWQRPEGGYNDSDLADALMREIGALHGVGYDEGALLSDLANSLMDLEGDHRPYPTTITALKTGMGRQFFSQRLNDINAKALGTQLPGPLARWFELCPVTDGEGNRLDFHDSGQWPVASKGAVYGTPLGLRQVSLTDARGLRRA